jgi:hypothetical protein
VYLSSEQFDLNSMTLMIMHGLGFPWVYQSWQVLQAHQWEQRGCNKYSKSAKAQGLKWLFQMQRLQWKVGVKMEYRNEKSSRFSVTNLLCKTRIFAEQSRWPPTCQGMCNIGQGLTGKFQTNRDEIQHYNHLDR